MLNLNFTDIVIKDIGCPFNIKEGLKVLGVGTVLKITASIPTHIPTDWQATTTFEGDFLGNGVVKIHDLNVSDLCGGLPTVTHTFKDYCVRYGDDDPC